VVDASAPSPALPVAPQAETAAATTPGPADDASLGAVPEAVASDISERETLAMRPTHEQIPTPVPPVPTMGGNAIVAIVLVGAVVVVLVALVAFYAFLAPR
jgi:hypothetical protein